MSATLEAVARRAAARSVAERARQLVTALNLHFAGCLVVALLNLYLLLHIVYAYRQAQDQSGAAEAQQLTLLKAAELSTLPLHGLDAKLASANREANVFYEDRLAASYSQLLTELGAVARRNQVKLSGVQYSQTPVLPGSTGELIEVRMDANLSGDYRPLVLFMNALERDHMFFLINHVALTGQQSGTVNLRLRLSTYLRPGAPTDPGNASGGGLLDGSTPPRATTASADGVGSR